MKKLIPFLLVAFLLSSCSASNLSVKDIPDSPCNNPLLIKLENKVESQQELTPEEMQTYLQLKAMCENQKNSLRTTNEMHAISKNLGVMVFVEILSVVGTFIALSSIK